jgi:hypothetical protein
MANNHEVSIIIRAKNALAAGLKSAGASLKSFGQSAWNIGKKAALALAGIGTALVGIGVKAVMAYGEAEKATTALKSALRSNGEEVDNNVASLKAQSAAIMEQTGIDDDSVVSMMARMKMLGVTTDKLGEASKGVIGLMNAGLSEEAAMKAVAMAHAGNFAALSRYIPAIRSATTEAEKAAAANDFMSKSYENSKDQLNTVGGAWGMLKTRMGNAWEEVGAAIANNDQLTEGLQMAGDAVKRFGERVAEWVASGGVPKLIAGVKEFAENARHNFKEVGLAWDLVTSVIADAWGTTGNYITNLLGAIKNNWVTYFEYMRDMALAVFEKIKHPFSEFKPPSMAPLKKAMGEYWDAIKGTGAKVTSAQDQTNAEIEAEAQRHAEALRKIEADKTAALANLGKKQVDNAKKTQEQITVAQTPKPDARKAQVEALKEDEKALAAQIKKHEALIEKTRELAQMRVADFIAKQREAKEEKKELANEDERAQKLQAKMRMRGRTISKRDQEWLAAFNQIKGAKNLLPKQERFVEQERAKLIELQNEQVRLLGLIRGDLKEAVEFH